MPNETNAAVEWSLRQTYNVDGYGYTVSKGDPTVVDFVRKYFNDNKIAYNSFSYDDLMPYL